jgi:hypothetical protein
MSNFQSAVLTLCDNICSKNTSVIAVGKTADFNDNTFVYIFFSQHVSTYAGHHYVRSVRNRSRQYIKCRITRTWFMVGFLLLQVWRLWYVVAFGTLYILIQLPIDTMLKSATTWKRREINTPLTTHSNQFQLFHDSSRQQYRYVQPHENREINTPPTTHQISSNFSATAADNSTGTYIIHYSIELIAFSTEYTLFNNCNFNLVYR